MDNRYVTRLNCAGFAIPPLRYIWEDVLCNARSGHFCVICGADDIAAEDVSNHDKGMLETVGNTTEGSDTNAVTSGDRTVLTTVPSNFTRLNRPTVFYMRGLCLEKGEKSVFVMDDFNNETWRYSFR